jgi:hypothetical protein
MLTLCPLKELDLVEGLEELLQEYKDLLGTNTELPPKRCYHWLNCWRIILCGERRPWQHCSFEGISGVITPVGNTNFQGTLWNWNQCFRVRLKSVYERELIPQSCIAKLEVILKGESFHISCKPKKVEITCRTECWRGTAKVGVQALVVWFWGTI